MQARNTRQLLQKADRGPALLRRLNARATQWRRSPTCESFHHPLTLLLAISMTALVSFASDGTEATGARPVTFTKDIAPIFQKSCQSCHHTGTSTPMSLMTYSEVRPWARSIK